MRSGSVVWDIQHFGADKIFEVQLRFSGVHSHDVDVAFWAVIFSNVGPIDLQYACCPPVVISA